MRLQYMAQNSFFLDEIVHEATKVQADAHLQNSLPGKGIPLKTTQGFIKNLLGIIFSSFKADLKSHNFQCLKFYKLFVCFVILLVAPAPLDL